MTALDYYLINIPFYFNSFCRHKKMFKLQYIFSHSGWQSHSTDPFTILGQTETSQQLLDALAGHFFTHSHDPQRMNPNDPTLLLQTPKKLKCN